jgi:InsA C-terminal domain
MAQNNGLQQIYPPEWLATVTGITKGGKRKEGRGRTFLLDYAYAGQASEVKQQIVDMAMNASGIRDTARVLHVSPTTVIKELKKRHLISTK